MIKKIVAGTIICTVLGTSNIMSYATPTNTNLNATKNNDKKAETIKESFEVVIPEKDFVTSNTNLVLSFKAPKDTKVSIAVYHNTSKEGEEENYVLTHELIEVTIGEIQMGWAEIELKSGLNKIEFTAEYKNGLTDSVVRHVNVMNVEEVKVLLEKIVNNSTLGVGKRP
ncbi:hypothetical protein [Alkaliphilus oremlandii]|uniref:Uncharacterized protein n=1 Tax=Alkaliphilus oremlandii (strain OhILAs) TaxID=350688 RepID=A8MKI1_ALKOO|nr:hypothetical protein [Alkaliphilus oremlandii]ABW20313.1 hypothetical protein Clos_2782 [Alkaliphilus oremlandii OhILAs]